LAAAEAELAWLQGTHELQKTLWQGPFKTAPAAGEDQDATPMYWYHDGTGESTWGDPLAELQSSFQITLKLFDIYCGMCREEMRLADVDAASRLSQAVTLIQMRWRGVLTRRQIRAKTAQMRDLAEMRRQRSVTDRFLAQHRRLGELLAAVFRGYKQRKLHKMVLKQRSGLTHRIPVEQKKLESVSLIGRWWLKYYPLRQARLRRELIRRFEEEYQLRNQVLALPAPVQEEVFCEDTVFITAPVLEYGSVTRLSYNDDNDVDVTSGGSSDLSGSRIDCMHAILEGFENGKLEEALQNTSIQDAAQGQPKELDQPQSEAPKGPTLKERAKQDLLNALESATLERAVLISKKEAKPLEPRNAETTKE
jgi:hypothetical protein